MSKTYADIDECMNGTADSGSYRINTFPEFHCNCFNGYVSTGTFPDTTVALATVLSHTLAKLTIHMLEHIPDITCADVVESYAGSTVTTNCGDGFFVNGNPGFSCDSLSGQRK